MNSVQDIVRYYTQLRESGTSAGVALEILRHRIEALPKTDQTEIVRLVKQVEATLKSPATAPVTPSAPPPVKPIPDSTPKPPVKPINPPTSTVNSPTASGTMRPLYVGVKTANCSKCGKPNPVDEVLCAHCGTFLQQGKSVYETSVLDDGTKGDTGYFGEDTVLLLMLRETNYAFKLRPQENRHDIVIGRSNGASMKPDIDLLDHGGDDYGVSRLHMSVRYEPKDKTVCVVDMNSANGTFLNGQRLHPREVRVLRHGDELRLGKLIMRVYFQHGVGAKK